MRKKNILVLINGTYNLGSKQYSNMVIKLNLHRFKLTFVIVRISNSFKCYARDLYF